MLYKLLIYVMEQTFILILLEALHKVDSFRSKSVGDKQSPPKGQLGTPWQLQHRARV